MNYREGIVEFIKNGRWTHAATFAFNKPGMDEIAGRRFIIDFHAAADGAIAKKLRKLLGPRWSKKTSGRLESISFPAQPQGNFHYHSALKVPALLPFDELCVIIDGCTRNIIPSASCKVDRLNPAGGWPWYVTLPKNSTGILMTNFVVWPE
jgi:hypothetical protein